jgi:hypothetical protein
MNRDEVLQAAINIITKDRNNQYGDPEDSFQVIADLWSAWMGVPFTVLDVAAFLILMKLARIHHNAGHLDSWIDIAGYAGCAGEIATKE